MEHLNLSPSHFMVSHLNVRSVEKQSRLVQLGAICNLGMMEFPGVGTLSYEPPSEDLRDFMRRKHRTWIRLDFEGLLYIVVKSQ